MIETMKSHNLQALTAIQIGIQYNIIVIHEDGEYRPYINGRIIQHENKVVMTERTPYFEGISVNVERYEKISIVYEDEKGQAHHRLLEGDLARIFQHQLDYAFGSTFIDRVNPKTREKILSHLEQRQSRQTYNGQCPTHFYRDDIKKATNILLGLLSFSLLLPLFPLQSYRSTLITLDKIVIAIVPLLILSYGLYAFYETRKYKQCTSCQTGNIVGNLIILILWYAAVALGFWLWLIP